MQERLQKTGSISLIRTLLNILHVSELLARICAIADTLAALIIDRPYRKRVSATIALAKVFGCRGTQVAPTVVYALQLIDMKKASHSAWSDENYLKTMLGQEKGAFERGGYWPILYRDFLVSEIWIPDPLRGEKLH